VSVLHVTVTNIAPPSDHTQKKHNCECGITTHLTPTMTGEKVTKGSVELPPPAASRSVSRPRRLRNAVALAAASGLLYLATTSWNNHRPGPAHPSDPLVGTSDSIRDRHKNFGFDPKKAENIFL
jgi:hypothetical protein